MYKAIVLTNKGAEKIASEELDELIKCKNISSDTAVVSFEAKDLLELCRLTYRSQSINKVLLLLFEVAINDSLEKTIAIFKKNLGKIDASEIKQWLSKDKTFKVECERHGTHGFHSTDIEIEAGKVIFDYSKNNLKVDLKTNFDNPDTRFFFFINEKKGYFGVDFAGIELSKRQYKIFGHPESLKGVTGYALCKFSGYNGKQIILDPFMGSGIIVIEAGLYASNFPVQYYNKEKLAFITLDFFKTYGQEKFFKEEDAKIVDKKSNTSNILGYDSQMRYLQSTQKNSKLAGIGKLIDLSRCEIEWLDTKLEKSSVDMIITDPPRLSKNRDEKKTLKVYNELFYQGEYVLKKKGTITLFGRFNEEIEKAAEKHKFKIIEKHALYQGKECFDVMIFKRKEVKK